MRASSILTVIFATCFMSFANAIKDTNHRSLQQSAIELSQFTVLLTSTIRSQNGDFLGELRRETARHLETIFWVWFNTEATESASYDFTTVGLTIKSFNFEEHDGDEKKYSASVTLSGSVYFDSENVPSQNIVDNLQVSAFQGNMLSAYLKDLRASSDEFLKATKGLRVDFEARKSNEPATLEEEKNASKTYVMMSTIFGVVLGLVSFFTITIGYLCLRRRVKSIQDDEDTMKGPESKENSVDIEQSSTYSMSPPPSPESVGSSKYTYNPQSVMDSITAGGTYVSSQSVVSKETAGTKNTINFDMNVDAWKAANPGLAATRMPELEADVSIISGYSTNRILDADFEVNPPTESSAPFDENFLPTETLKAIEAKTQGVSSKKIRKNILPRTAAFTGSNSDKNETGNDEDASHHDLKALSFLIKQHRSEPFKSTEGII